MLFEKWVNQASKIDEAMMKEITYKMFARLDLDGKGYFNIAEFFFLLGALEHLNLEKSYYDFF